jgi:hypothetical protein
VTKKVVGLCAFSCAALVVLLSSTLITYRLLTIRSYQLYIDEQASGTASGILPWKKNSWASNGETWTKRL